MQEAT